MYGRLYLTATLIAVGLLTPTANVQGLNVDVVNGDLIGFQPDGAWSWYQDERVMVADGQILVGSVAAKRQGDFPIQNFTRNPGDVISTTYTLANGRRSFFELHNTLETDDHNAPGFLKLPDGNYLTAYTKHATDSLIRIRKTTVPGDSTSWGSANRLPAVGDRPDPALRQKRCHLLKLALSIRRGHRPGTHLRLFPQSARNQLGPAFHLLRRLGQHVAIRRPAYRTKRHRRSALYEIR